MEDMTFNELVLRGILPPIHVSKDEDSLWTLEWIFPKGIRFGLNIEKDKKDSGWHVVGEGISACGPLYDVVK